MANYVWNRIVCNKNTLEKYFIDYDPCGEEDYLDEPFITFNKLFGAKSFKEFYEHNAIGIYNGFGFHYDKLSDGRWQILFCTRWEYPIKAIKMAITLDSDIEWYAVEENCIFVSKFTWNEGITENVMLIEKEYDEWRDDQWDFLYDLEDYDYGVWYYLQNADDNWFVWETDDDYKRYEGPVAQLKLPFYHDNN